MRAQLKENKSIFDGWKTIGHVPREILGYIYFFIKKEGGKISGNVKSFNYWTIPNLTEPASNAIIGSIISWSFFASNHNIKNKQKKAVNFLEASSGFPLAFSKRHNRQNGCREQKCLLNLT